VSAIDQARETLIQGDLSSAVSQYGALIKSRQSLPDVIRDLTEATYRYPVESPIWQTLGDAYMRSDQIQEALDAYTKAEELLR
jgi:cytochrome c-type biogenesis protein CcmH/NrfG